MSTITKEQAKDLRNAFECWQQDYDPVEDKEQYDMFGLGMVAMDTLLASLELERGMIRRFDLDMRDCDSCGQDCGADMVEDLDGECVLWDEVLPHLYRYDEYTAPPAPVSVPDEMAVTDEMTVTAQMFARGHNACRASILQHGVIPNWEPLDGQSPYDAPYKIPSNLRELISEEIDILFSDDDAQGIWNACRAAMLQGAENAETPTTMQAAPALDSSPKIAESPTGINQGKSEPVTTANKFPFEQWLSQQTGTIDVECGCVMTEVFFHWLRVAYEAGNSPVIPDGWVACSERMPEEGSKVIVFRPRASESNDPPVKTATYKGGREYYHGFDCYCEPTHWMPMPAAPQQEA